MPEALHVWSALLVLCLSYVCSDALKTPSEDRRLTMVYRRGDVSGLFPFPRVGRSQISSEDIFGQSAQGGGPQGPVSKRQGLIPFPRVGKRDRHHVRSVPLFLAPRLIPSTDAFYDDYVQGRPVKGVARGAEEEGPWDLSLAAAEEVKRSGDGGGQEGMWFGPRLGRRRRRSAEGLQGSVGAKHSRSGGLLWVDEAGGSPGAYLERRPDFSSILRGNKQRRPSLTDEDDLSPEDADLLLYGDAAEAPGVDGEEESPLAGGRRKRRQPEDPETKKEAGSSGWGGDPGRV